MQEPLWIGKEAALAMHDRQLAEHGGIEGVRDEGLLESALAKPQNVFFYANEQVDMARLAASYAYGIATNHPFLDGNKRTALVVSRAFLLLNGYNLIASQEEKYLAIIGIASGEWSEEELSAWFAANTKKTQHK
jgi:death-on-curing protein